MCDFCEIIEEYETAKNNHDEEDYIFKIDNRFMICNYYGRVLKRRCKGCGEVKMPVHKIKGGYKFGKSGKLYKGKGAKKKAQKQARAIYASGYKGR